MDNSLLTLNKLRSLTALKRFELDYIPHDRTDGEVHYNAYTGYVFIEYKAGVSIAIFEGRDAEDQVLMLTYDEEGEEIEIDSIEEFRKYFK